MKKIKFLMILLIAGLALFAATKWSYTINPSQCVGCGDCVRGCPKNAITLENGIYTIQKDKCVGCRRCFQTCTYDAIKGRQLK